MKILLPDNIFSRILSSVFNEKDKSTVSVYPSSLLSKNLIELKDAIALIPTLDLLNHKNFYVSHSLGISFDESISNSYIYFNNKDKIVSEVVLAGDVSSNEAILTKILFSETYGTDVQLSFEKINGSSSEKNRILVGDRNFVEDNLDSAISFAEEIIELVSAPYVNFIFASESENILKEFHLKYQEIISAIDLASLFEKLNEKFTTAAKNYLDYNLQHVVFNIDENDLTGFKQLLQLPYLHGIIKDMVDVKFV